MKLIACYVALVLLGCASTAHLPPTSVARMKGVKYCVGITVGKVEAQVCTERLENCERSVKKARNSILTKMAGVTALSDCKRVEY